MKVVPMSLNMQKKTFKVDHPFLFFIHSPKAVFFAGRFVDPLRKTNSSCEDRLNSISESMRVELSQMSTQKLD